ncbi:probable F420-dependent oxidoreductase, MSMEG_4141 family [Williamsia sterculiae]|uniref:Probable F420-dependent oxidoreductase, MSMEG_4141 family n=1 Tax=Williamsia sterculiae TaxID=1344003 RepID=A0A1N7GSA1_9NOCA|nr:probable F420-dependent oxidoreductase, MSMEG_4141 family [Williamsia sterculiae]
MVARAMGDFTQTSLGRKGVWAGYPAISPEQAAQIENLGYTAIWLGGSPKDLSPVRRLLDATSTITLATGITNIWNTDPAAIAAEYLQVEADHPNRFLLGVGAGHPEATAEYRKPYDAVVDYLNVLDDGGVPAHRRVLAALGPRMLRLSADRALGAHPYLTVPQHTAEAREILGPDALLAPEQKVVLNTDPAQARAIGRPPVDTPYLHLRNYTNNLKRLGYTDADIADGGSDALIDALVAHGSAADIVRRLDEHLDAGADHVGVQVLSSDGQDLIGVLEQIAAEWE